MATGTDSMEPHLAEAIALIGREGFEAALWRLVTALALPDNMLVLVYRDAGPALELYQRANDPKIFGRLQSALS